MQEFVQKWQKQACYTDDVTLNGLITGLDDGHRWHFSYGPDLSSWIYWVDSAVYLGTVYSIYKGQNLQELIVRKLYPVFRVDIFKISIAGKVSRNNNIRDTFFIQPGRPPAKRAV